MIRTLLLNSFRTISAGYEALSQSPASLGSATRPGLASPSPPRPSPRGVDGAASPCCRRVSAVALGDLRHSHWGDLLHPSASPLCAFGLATTSSIWPPFSQERPIRFWPMAAPAFVGRCSSRHRCDRQRDADRPSRSGRPVAARHHKHWQPLAARSTSDLSVWSDTSDPFKEARNLANPSPREKVGSKRRSDVRYQGLERRATS